MLPNQQMSHVKIFSDRFVNQLHHPEKHFSVKSLGPEKTYSKVLNSKLLPVENVF